MQNIVLISPKGFCLSFFRENLSDEWLQFIEDEGHNYLRFSGPEFSWMVKLEETIQDGSEFCYREECRANEDLDIEFRAHLDEFSFFFVWYTSNGASMFRRFFPVLVNLIREKLPLHEFWVDLSYGKVWRADRYLSMAERDPTWSGVFSTE